MEEIFQFIVNDTYLKFFSWFLGILSFFLTFYQFFGRKSSIEKNKDNIVNLSRRTKGICADCDSIISSNSLSCLKCGSSTPFSSEILMRKILEDLDDYFYLAENFSKEHESIFLNMKIHIFLYIPVSLIVLFIIYILQLWNNMFFYMITGGVIYFILMLFISAPFELLYRQYEFDSGLYKFKKSNLGRLSNRIECFINSIKDKDSLDYLQHNIVKYINIIDNSCKFNNKDIIWYGYSLCLLFSILLSPHIFIEVSKILFEIHIFKGFFGIIIVFPIMILIYLPFFLTQKLFWFHSSYLTTIISSGRFQMEQYLYLLEKHD